MTSECSENLTADQLGRPLRSLRVSVTDRCNLRCTYCMPEEEYVWLPREDILRFSEIERLVRAFTDLGVDKLRVTGGEPLVRHDLAKLVAGLSGDSRITDIALTTNALLLPKHGQALVEAGVKRVTISLDTLRPKRFHKLAGRDSLDQALSGIRAAAEFGFEQVKINSVVLRGENDDELDDLLAFAAEVGAELRFIEYMDVGGATLWNDSTVVSRAEILRRVGESQGEVEPVAKRDWAPADRFRLPGGQVFGVISSTTEPFCATCDRSRLTADGMWYHCLYARSGMDLRGVIRAGASDQELRDTIASAWQRRSDRGAEERLALRERGRLAAPDELRSNPHLEMHTRGG